MESLENRADVLTFCSHMRAYYLDSTRPAAVQGATGPIARFSVQESPHTVARIDGRGRTLRPSLT